MSSIIIFATYLMVGGSLFAWLFQESRRGGQVYHRGDLALLAVMCTLGWLPFVVGLAALRTTAVLTHKLQTAELSLRR